MDNMQAIESLRTFAERHGTEHVTTWDDAGDKVHLLQFANMCVAALAGEVWAELRIEESAAYAALGTAGELRLLEAIRDTDTRRPKVELRHQGSAVRS
jgi:hypothetical protein